jgi:hypothetical protein
VQWLFAGKYFDVYMMKRFLYLQVFAFIRDHHAVRVEFQRLPDQQLRISVARKHFHHKRILVCPDHIQRLRTDGTGAAKDRYVLFILQFFILKLIIFLTNTDW